MALTPNFVLDELDHSDKTFVLLGPTKNGAVLRADATTGPFGRPDTLYISHGLEGKGDAQANTVIISSNRTRDTGAGVRGTGSASLKLKQPVNGAITYTEMYNVIANFVAMFVGNGSGWDINQSFVRSLLVGES